MSNPIDASGTFTLLGGTTIRRMGFGAMRITGEGIWGPPADPEAAKALLRRVVELGVNFIDTADSYGPEVSESLIGEALAPYGDEVIVATKAGLVRSGPGEWASKGDPAHIKAACDGSLKRLRMERIPLYQLHRIDSEVPVAESIGALLELREAGKIDQIGLSEVGVEELRQVQAMTHVASVQNHFHAGKREWSDVVDVCAAEGIAFIPWYPLGAGDLGEAATLLDDLAGIYDTTRFAIALAWLLHRSPAIVPIPGTSSIPHLEQNVAASALLERIPEEAWGPLDRLS